MAERNDIQDLSGEEVELYFGKETRTKDVSRSWLTNVTLRYAETQDYTMYHSKSLSKPVSYFTKDNMEYHRTGEKTTLFADNNVSDENLRHAKAGENINIHVIKCVKSTGDNTCQIDLPILFNSATDKMCIDYTFAGGFINGLESMNTGISVHTFNLFDAKGQLINIKRAAPGDGTLEIQLSQEELQEYVEHKGTKTTLRDTLMKMENARLQTRDAIAKKMDSERYFSYQSTYILDMLSPVLSSIPSNIPVSIEKSNIVFAPLKFEGELRKTVKTQARATVNAEKITAALAKSGSLRPIGIAMQKIPSAHQGDLMLHDGM